MTRPWLLSCAKDSLAAIRDGRKRCMLLPEMGIKADERVIFRCGEQSTSGMVTLVEPIEGDGSMLVHFARVWTHASGDDHEELLAMIERGCNQLRELSHPGTATDLERTEGSRRLAAACRLWDAATPEKMRGQKP